MSRISRNCYESNFFHLMVQGIKKEYIFTKNIFKEKYIKYLIEEAEKCNVKILAYCIMENHAHILVYVKSIADVSKIMHVLNTRYAIYYNKKLERCGYVFRDRYRCENILTESHLENCIRYIHKNPVVAGLCEKESDYVFSTYNQYMKKSGIISDDIIKLCFKTLDSYKVKLNYELTTDKYIDITNEFGNSKKEDIDNVINEILNREKTKIEELNEVKISRIVKEILKRCKTSKKEIAEKLKLERTKLFRILKKTGN